MKKSKFILTISIVNYNSENRLINCLKSIYEYLPPFSFEVIIYDNSPKESTLRNLKKVSKDIKYIESGKNLGFGAGHNRVCKLAKGKYIFILNPDIKLKNNSVWRLTKLLENEQVGIVAPKIIQKNGKTEKSVSATPTPYGGIVYYSFIGKYFPNNRISKRFWYRDYRCNTPKKVEFVSGAAFFIRKDLFDRLEGFDESFFLYFEDNDLCLRILKLNKKIIYYPEAVIIHEGGSSSPKRMAHKFFRRSRFFFFKKHYSFFKALSLELFLRTFEYIASFKS